MKTRESGPREKLTVLMPFSPGNGKHEAALDILRRQIAERTGGFSEYEGNGVWIDPETGETAREYHLRFEVSYVPRDVHSTALILAFKHAARTCGNTWLHIERSTFEAEHRKVR